MDSDRYSILFQLKLQDDGHSFKLNAIPAGAPANDGHQGDGQQNVVQTVAPGDTPAP